MKEEIKTVQEEAREKEALRWARMTVDEREAEARRVFSIAQYKIWGRTEKK